MRVVKSSGGQDIRPGTYFNTDALVEAMITAPADENGYYLAQSASGATFAVTADEIVCAF